MGIAPKLSRNRERVDALLPAADFNTGPVHLMLCAMFANTIEPAWC
jgi:hypothetical protein